MILLTPTVEGHLLLFDRASDAVVCRHFNSDWMWLQKVNSLLHPPAHLISSRCQNHWPRGLCHAYRQHLQFEAFTDFTFQGKGEQLLQRLKLTSFWKLTRNLKETLWGKRMIDRTLTSPDTRTGIFLMFMALLIQPSKGESPGKRADYRQERLPMGTLLSERNNLAES